MNFLKVLFSTSTKTTKGKKATLCRVATGDYFFNTIATTFSK